MKVIILAGGFGTRLAEETSIRPKPMVEIGGMPILWHIMKSYSSFGYNDFVVLLGYKGYYIKEYFTNYFLHHSDLTVNLANNSLEIHNSNSEPWKVTLLDTGLNTMTGGRIKRASDVIGKEPFMLTYGDGVANINIQELVDFHKSHGRLMTMTSVQPKGRFGALSISSNNQITSFKEKPKGDGSWINGGFFVCEARVLDYITDSDSVVFEQEPLQNLAKDLELMSFKHDGFWQSMDSLKDKNDLNKLWDQNEAEWKTW